MDRRNFFRLFGGAVAAAVLPLGALALPRFAPLSRRNTGVEINFSHNVNMGLEEFEDRYIKPWSRRLSDRIDNEVFRSLI
jgi:hypothetical protein